MLTIKNLKRLLTNIYRQTSNKSLALNGFLKDKFGTQRSSVFGHFGWVIPIYICAVTIHIFVDLVYTKDNSQELFFLLRKIQR